MNPFVYPKSRHLRRERPGALSTYQQYKPFLQSEFQRKCVYCRMPDSMTDYSHFGVDHYRPKKRFPGQVTAYANLFYCCNPCNRRKGDYWPPRGMGSTHFVPNPCDHEMFRHLRFNRAAVETKTTAGEVAEQILDLNDPEIVAYRMFVLDLLETSEAEKAAILTTQRDVVRLRDSGMITPVVARDILAELEEDIVQVDANINRLGGL